MPAFHRPPPRGRAGISNDPLFAILRPAWGVLYGTRPAFVRALAADLGVDEHPLQRRVVNLETGMCRPRASELHAMGRLLGIHSTLLLAIVAYINDTDDTTSVAGPAALDAISA